jgi:hypothetical protein
MIHKSAMLEYTVVDTGSCVLNHDIEDACEPGVFSAMSTPRGKVGVELVCTTVLSIMYSIFPVTAFTCTAKMVSPEVYGN